MPSILGYIEDVPMFIGDIGLVVTTVETVVPLAKAAEQALAAAVLTPARKLAADFQAVLAAVRDKSSLSAILVDAEALGADTGALWTALEALIPLAESKTEAIWADIVAPAAKLKADLGSLAPAVTAPNTDSGKS